MKKYGSFKRDFNFSDFDQPMALKLLGYVGMLNRCMDSAIKTGNPNESIMTFLKEMGLALNADRTYIFQKNAHGHYDNTYEWCNEGVTPEKETLQDMPAEAYEAQWGGAFANNSGYFIRDMEDYKEVDPIMYQVLKRQGINQLVVSPFYFEGNQVGFLGADNPSVEQLDLCIPLMQLASSYMASLLRHSIFVEKRGNSTDTLTGLSSEVAFNKHLLDEVALIKGTKSDVQNDVVYFDISNFKFFNKEHGYQEGDKLLQKMAAVLRREVGTYWIVRPTSDRFYAVIEDERVDDVIRTVHDVMEKYSVSIRAGIYPISASDESPEIMMDRARMTANTTQGNYRTYYTRYADQMEADMVLSNYLISHIDEAIAKGWIKVYYQPIVDTFSSKISTYEALARWVDPQYGFLNPFQFIDVLERGHLIHKLDLYILELVCRDLEDDRKKGELSPVVSVNLSRYDLELDDLHEQINAILAKYGVGRDQVRIEITESALINNSEAVIKDHISRFHEDGYLVWLDDFGSGMSSLNSLQTFDFDLLKIDMAFLRNANERTPIILTDIIDMAKRLDIKTLAEGVETEKEYDFLHSIGCVLTQGYYFSKPLPRAEVAAKMRDRGLMVETAEEHNFYREVGRVNIVNPDFSFRDRLNDQLSEMPAIMVFLEEEGQYKTICANHTAQKWAQVLGIKETSELDDRLNRAVGANYALLNQLLKAAKRGEDADAEFEFKGRQGYMRVRKVAESTSAHAYISKIVIFF